MKIIGKHDSKEQYELITETPSFYFVLDKKSKKNKYKQVNKNLFIKVDNE